MADRTYTDITKFLKTEYGKKYWNMDPDKDVLFQDQLCESKMNFCKVCRKTFYSRMTFRQHQSNAQCRRKPYSCHLCNRSYSEMNILSMHQVIVHGYNRVVINNYCYTKYSKSTPLDPKNYNLKHKSLLDLQNSLQNRAHCNRAFSSKHDIKNHITHSLIHRVNTLAKDLKCHKINRTLKEFE